MLRRCLVAALLLASQVNGFGSLCGDNQNLQKPASLPDDANVLLPNTLVALFGDQGRTGQSRGGTFPERVLRMIRDKNCHFLIHSGDYDYADNPAAMATMIDGILGANYPYFANIGNHDLVAWTGTNGYEARLRLRLQNSNMAQYCWGDLAVNMACNYRGILFVLSGVGTRGSGHVNFIDTTFSQTTSAWKLCTWHKNQRLMQIGGKTDEVGWQAYEMCRTHGAMIVTGHEHSWCRSHTMSSTNPQVVAHTNNPVTLRRGQTIVVVSGVGGRELRAWDDTLRRNAWWASVAATNNNIADGVLFCRFFINNDPNLAQCWFEDINGRIIDNFNMRTFLTDKEVVESAFDNVTRCVGEMVEYAVASPEDDAVEDEQGAVLCDALTHSAASGRRVALRFNNIDLDASDIHDVEHIHLQVYGAQHASGATKMVISAERGPSAPLSCGKATDLSARATTERAEVWTTIEGDAKNDWERHEVWVSGDLTSVVAEAVRSPAWVRGSDLTIFVDTEGPERLFYSHDRSNCLAPTLSVQFKDRC